MTVSVVDPRPAALGGVRQQLVAVIDAARADGSANVIVSCGPAAVELCFADERVVAAAGRDASRSHETALSIEDRAVLMILGWRCYDSSEAFVREWHPDTSSSDVADDVMRTALHAYQCESLEIKVLLGAPTAVPELVNS
jgi:hypothetical protein